jgi:hypothetical protein
MDRAAADIADLDPDAGTPVKHCPIVEAAVVVQVWCPENARLLGDTSVRLTGPEKQQGRTATDSGAVTFRPLQPGTYSLQLTLSDAHARHYRVDAPAPFTLAEGESRQVVIPARCVTPKAVATVQTKTAPRLKAEVKTRPGSARATVTPPPERS